MTDWNIQDACAQVQKDLERWITGNTEMWPEIKNWSLLLNKEEDKDWSVFELVRFKVNLETQVGFITVYQKHNSPVPHYAKLNSFGVKFRKDIIAGRPALINLSNLVIFINYKILF